MTSARYEKTLRAVCDAVRATRDGKAVVWVHSEGHPPPSWAREVLLAAGVQIQSVTPARQTETERSPLTIIEDRDP